MSFKIVISEEAEFQIFEALTYYSKINNSLAEKFNNELIKIIDYLADNPEYFQNRYKDTRCAF